MFNFNLQRFASDGSDEYTLDEGAWMHADGYWGYVIAGSSLWDDENSGDSQIEEGGFAYYITGIDSATGANSETVTLTLSGDVSGVTVYNGTSLDQGADRTALTVIIGGTTYAVNSSGKLYIPEPAEDTGTVISTAVVNRLKRANGKIITQNLNYINPDAADSDIALAITALNSLSQNTKEEIVRVNRTVIG